MLPLTLPSIPVLVSCGLVVLGAGVVRGYSGFGFSMITVLGLSIFLKPMEVVPAILLLEIVASGWLLPKVFRQVDWPGLAWLFLGVILGTPLGVYLLGVVPDRIMRVCIALTVMILVILLRRGFAVRRPPGPAVTSLVGLASGLFNGAAAIGGPPVVLFYFSSPVAAAVGRASLIAFFVLTDVVALGTCLTQGLVTTGTLTLSMVFLPPLLLGLTLGSRSYLSTAEQTFRRRVLTILFLLALVALIRNVLD